MNTGMIRPCRHRLNHNAIEWASPGVMSRQPGIAESRSIATGSRGQDFCQQ